MHKLLSIMIAVLFIFTSAALFAAPAGPSGFQTDASQPDGTVLDIRGYGDEFYHWFATPEGYTVVFDSTTSTWFYAQTTADKSALIPSIYQVGKVDPAAVGLSQNIQISNEARIKNAVPLYESMVSKSVWSRKGMERKIERLKNMGATEKDIKPLIDQYNTYHADQGYSATLNAVSGKMPNIRFSAPNLPNYLPPPEMPKNHKAKGVIILVKFKDEKEHVSQSYVNEMVNKKDFNDITYKNAGSVRDYYYDQSNGNLDFQNAVTTYYIEADFDRAHYSAYNQNYGGIALLIESLEKLKSTDVDLNDLTYAEPGIPAAVTLLYNGNIPNSAVERVGLWPHSWDLRVQGNYRLPNGDIVGPYMVSQIGTNPGIGTMCHEFGHLICNFDDYYDYGDSRRYSMANIDRIQSAGLGIHCGMSSGNDDKRPASINAYLKAAIGWYPTFTPEKNIELQLESNPNFFYKYINPKKQWEYFILEYRQFETTGAARWNYNLPANGFTVWHVDENVITRNEYQQRTNAMHYEVSLEQADGKYDLERYQRGGVGNFGDSKDYFKPGSSFDINTSPNSKWWDGTTSGLSITFKEDKKIVLGELIPQPKPQIITINGSAIDTVYTRATGRINAYSNSGLPISYASSNSNILSITTDGYYSAKAIGNAEVTLTQKGDSRYFEAEPVIMQMNVIMPPYNQKPQVISLQSPAFVNVKPATTGKVSATANSGLQLTYHSSDNTIVTINQLGAFTALSNGTATISINQGGNDEWNPAPPQNITINVSEDGGDNKVIKVVGLRDANMNGKLLEKALKDASPGQTIYVGSGKYAGKFVMAPGVNVYGGFIGNSWNMQLRDSTQTIIDASGTTDSSGFNAVLSEVSGTAIPSEWDGLTFIGGSGNRIEQTFNDSKITIIAGGAICIHNAGTKISNSIIKSSAALDPKGVIPGFGGGIYGGTVENCYIYDNRANAGGGICGSMVSGSFILNNTVIASEKVNYGGGAADATLIGSFIANNTATDGGGIAASKAKNCIIVNNTALENGGGAARSALINCTVAMNEGGGISEGVTSNSILWGNIQQGIYVQSKSATISFSAVQEENAARSVGNISLSPLNKMEDGPKFIAPSNFTGAVPSRLHDILGTSWRTAANLLIDCGSREAYDYIPVSMITDYSGNARFYNIQTQSELNAKIDIGPYEMRRFSDIMQKSGGAGALTTVSVNEITAIDGTFDRKPSVFATYYPPFQNKNAPKKALFKVWEAGDDLLIELKSKILLYDKSALTWSYKSGDGVREFIAAGYQKSSLKLNLGWNGKVNGTQYKNMESEVFLEIFPPICDSMLPSIQAEDGSTLGLIRTASADNIQLTGYYFGKTRPKVWIEYTSENSKSIKKYMLKVDSLPPVVMTNPVYKSFTDADGKSSVRISAPKKLPSDIKPGMIYTLVIDSGSGLGVYPIIFE